MTVHPARTPLIRFC